MRGWFALVLLLAALLRLHGIAFNLDFDDPDRALLDQVDERGMVEAVLAAIDGRDLHPREFLNRGPGGFVFFLGADLVFVGWQALWDPRGWEGALQALRDNPCPLHLVHRLVSAAAGVVSVWVLVRWLRREFDAPSALCAGAVLAVAYQPVRDAHFGRVDVLWSLFVLLALERMFRVVRAPSVRSYLAAGALVGVATSIKYLGALLLLPLAAAHFLARSGAQRAGARPPGHARFALGAGAAPLGVLLLFPGIVGAFDELVATLSFAYDHYSPQIDPLERLAAAVKHLRYSLAVGLGETAFVLALSGAWSAWRRGSAGRWLLLGILLLAPMLVLTTFSQPRFADPLLVLLAGAAGLGLAALAPSLPRWGWLALLGVALAPSLARSVSFGSLIRRTDTRVEMLAELERRALPRAEVLGVGTHHGLPRPAQRSQLPYVPYYELLFGRGLLTSPPRLAPEFPARLAALLERPPRWILWDDSEPMLPLPGGPEISTLVARAYREVVRFDGQRVPVRLPDPVTAQMVPYVRPWLMHRPGPRLILYERIE